MLLVSFRKFSPLLSQFPKGVSASVLRMSLPASLPEKLPGVFLPQYNSESQCTSGLIVLSVMWHRCRLTCCWRHAGCSPAPCQLLVLLSSPLWFTSKRLLFFFSLRAGESLMTPVAASQWINESESTEEVRKETERGSGDLAGPTSKFQSSHLKSSETDTNSQNRRRQ